MIFTSAFVVLMCTMIIRATKRNTMPDWFDRVLGVVFIGSALTMAGCVLVASVRAMP